MNRIRAELRKIVEQEVADDPEAAHATGASLDRLLDLELAIMLHTYIEAREQAQAQRSYLERELHKRFEGPLSPPRVVRILTHACRALAEAHGRGLVHRDIKPANLYLACLGGEPDFVKVLDFGMVKTDPSMYSTRLTMASGCGGTPAYMAPETATGDESIDGRADLYSIGCTGYFLLTGQLVFQGSNAMRLLVRHLQEEAEPPSARNVQPIPEALDKLVLDCLAKNPDDRPNSARDIIDRLAGIETEPWSERAALDWWREHMPTALEE